MTKRKKPSISTGHVLLTAAEALSAEGRLESALSILEYLEEQAHELPVVRRLFSSRRRMKRAAGRPDKPFPKNLWVGYGAVNSRPKCLTVLDEISDLNWSTDCKRVGDPT